MSPIEHYLTLSPMYRVRTLGTLAAIEKLPDPQKVLGWRPGPGRAHLAWQLVHIGVTEELFATERFLGTVPGYQDLLPRFRGGSTVDDDIPPLPLIKDVLGNTREHLHKTVSSLTERDLDVIPAALKERGISIGKALQILTWHEAHHQGQAHITLNLYKAARIHDLECGGMTRFGILKHERRPSLEKRPNGPKQISRGRAAHGAALGHPR